VVLKPNAQWWNQGRTNLAAMKGFIDLVLGIPGFSGEVIIGENHHFMDESLPDDQKDNVRGWVHLSEINGDVDGVNRSLNTLVPLYQDLGIKNVTKSHWRDGGAKAGVWGNGQNGGIIKSPGEGDGYIWSDIDYVFESLWGLKKWKVKMTYPVFTSAYSGITIDFKNGAFERDGKGGGRYVQDRPVKFVNFAGLNDHGANTGITSATKKLHGHHRPFMWLVGAPTGRVRQRPRVRFRLLPLCQRRPAGLFHENHKKSRPGHHYRRVGRLGKPDRYF
jgi:hypothetical protein